MDAPFDLEKMMRDLIAFRESVGFHPVSVVERAGTFPSHFVTPGETRGNDDPSDRRSLHWRGPYPRVGMSA